MKIEHLALNVPNSVAMANWYIENLGFTMVKSINESPFVRFIADNQGSMLELYQNNEAPILNYKAMHHLSLHLAFESEAPEEDIKRLVEKGASFIEKIETNSGDILVMMKDPWGVAIQFCKRAEKMIKQE